MDSGGFGCIPLPPPLRCHMDMKLFTIKCKSCKEKKNKQTKTSLLLLFNYCSLIVISLVCLACPHRLRMLSGLEIEEK